MYTSLVHLLILLTVDHYSEPASSYIFQFQHAIDYMPHKALIKTLETLILVWFANVILQTVYESVLVNGTSTYVTWLKLQGVATPTDTIVTALTRMKNLDHCFGFMTP